MTTTPSRWRAAAGWAAAAVLTGIGAPTATAAPAEPATHLCSVLRAQQADGIVRAVRLEGDLVVDVPLCQVWSSSIVGDVRLEAGASFAMTATTVHGSIRRASADATSHVDVWQSAVTGDVVANGLQLMNSTVHGDVVADTAIPPKNHWPLSSAVILGWSRVGGSVTADAQYVSVDGGSVLGAVDATASEFVRVQRAVLGSGLAAHGDTRLVVHDSSVAGAVDADRTRDVLVCRTDITGDVVLTGTRMWTRVGEEGTSDCRVRVGGSVHVLDNPSTVVLGDVRVVGDLVCANNTGSQGVVRRPALVVGGTRSPGCA